MNSKSHSSKRRVFLKFDEIVNYHYKSIVDTKVDKEIELKNFFSIYSTLDNKFKVLELYIRTIESKKENDYNDLLLLSNYKYILQAKNKLYELQKNLHLILDKDIYIKYSNLKYNKDKYAAISMDYVYFYLENINANIDFNKIISNKLNSYNNNFYLDLFKFYVMFILLINININHNKSDSRNLFINYAFLLKRFLKEFNV